MPARRQGVAALYVPKNHGRIAVRVKKITGKESLIETMNAELRAAYRRKPKKTIQLFLDNT
jgi:hypothetical protein